MMQKFLIGFSVKFKYLKEVGKAYLVTDFQGNEDYVPQQYCYVNHKKDEIIIAYWLLKQKSFVFSRKKEYTINIKENKVFKRDKVSVEIITPKKVVFNPNEQPNESLIK